MELVLQQKQKLNLVMTMELRQAIAILQYSTVELYDYLQHQELENPLIELTENEDVHFEKGSIPIKNMGGSGKNPIDFLPDKKTNEREMLLEQVTWLDISHKEKALLHYLIFTLDENGYLPSPEEEISSELGLELESVRTGIETLQKLEPVGVGARNLAECLYLQVKTYYPDDEVTELIIKSHLEQLANKKWQEISKSLNIELAEVKRAFETIRLLNPKPCQLEQKAIEYVTPDIIVEEHAGDLAFYLNDKYLPKVEFNRSYNTLIDGKNELNKYVKDKYKSYQMLMSSLEQRRSTILKVTEAIINKQERFFTEGFSGLNPLTLKEIADEIDMHESTVSRSTMNKFIQTPRGTFELRIFFTSKLNTNNGENASQTKVKLLLEEHIKNENKYKPHSDQKIADYFKTKKGITISRRTVAKYREELNILSSSKRKEVKV
ncbi:RNA polymerase factor sigma-54 [Virgibacillus oceani]